MTSHFDLDAVKKMKLHVSLPVFLALMLVVWKGDDAVFAWLDSGFISEVEAADMQEQIKGAVDVSNSTSKTLLAYIQREELRDARQSLQRLEDQIIETDLWESQNGENAMTRARTKDLNERVVAREDQIDCLKRNDGSDCDAN